MRCMRAMSTSEADNATHLDIVERPEVSPELARLDADSVDLAFEIGIG